MKTSAIILAALLIMNISEARVLANTVSYEGEVIAHFELPEVEIKGEKIRVKQAENSAPAKSIRYKGETISEIDLPEVVINETYIEPINAKNIAVLHSPASIAEGVIIKESDNKLKKDEVKKPFFHQLANKIYDAGFKILQTVSEGLFFRS